LLVALLGLIGFVISEPGKRLIKVNEYTEAHWLTEEEVEFLIRIGVQFMDITEFPDLHLGEVPKINMDFPSGPSHQSTVNPLITTIQHQRFIDDLTYFSQTFFTRYYRSTTGVQSAEWLFGRVRLAAGNRSDITVTQFTHTGYDQKSIVARLTGRIPGPIVVIGAHQDSINVQNTANRSPGADDNGSGSITVLEILRVIAASSFVPTYTIEFQWYAAEEAGLLGSQAIANDYKNRGVAVYAMFNLDMTAYTPNSQTPAKVLYDFTNTELAAFTATVLEEYTSLTWRTHSCGYGCSDHASYYRAGYPSSSIFEPQTNPQIHTTQDDLPLVQWGQTLEYIKLGLAVVIELSFGG